MTTDPRARPETLQALVRRARTDRQMSLRDVERESGGDVVFSTVHAIENGTRIRVGPKALKGLSKALRVPLPTLRAAQGQTAAVPTEPFVVPDRANGLTAKQRRLVLAVIDGLLEAGDR